MTMLDMENGLATALGENGLTEIEKTYIKQVILLDTRTYRLRYYDIN